MADFELSVIPAPRMSPNLLLGVASPLWGYFGAAAAGGVAWWWMTRWSRPQNLEALFGQAATAIPDAAAAMAAPLADAAEAVMTVIEAVVPDLPPEAVGGEAAPISPILEVTAAPEPEPGSAPEAAAEPAEFELAKPRVRKPSTPNGSDVQA